jgi:hypothetical protein
MPKMSRKSRPDRRKKAVKKMYVLVRNDLASTYKNVQGAHALALFAMEHSKEFQEWNNTTLVFLGAGNLKDIREWILKLTKRKKVFSVFYEPDLDDQTTAIACYDTGIIFRKLYLA